MLFKRIAVMTLGLLATAVAQAGSAGAVTKSMMAGGWTAVLSGNTGCGITSMHVTFGLNSSGVGVATITGHSTGCPNSTTTGNAIKILTLAANGRGTANLACGAGCGWNFRIQVAGDGKSFILTDVDPANPNNTPTGMAIHTTP